MAATASRPQLVQQLYTSLMTSMLRRARPPPWVPPELLGHGPVEGPANYYQAHADLPPPQTLDGAGRAQPLRRPGSGSPRPSPAAGEGGSRHRRDPSHHQRANADGGRKRRRNRSHPNGARAHHGEQQCSSLCRCSTCTQQHGCFILHAGTSISDAVHPAALTACQLCEPGVEVI